MLTLHGHDNLILANLGFLRYFQVLHETRRSVEVSQRDRVPMETHCEWQCGHLVLQVLVEVLPHNTLFLGVLDCPSYWGVDSPLSNVTQDGVIHVVEDHAN